MSLANLLVTSKMIDEEMEAVKKPFQSEYLDVSPEARAALSEGRPVVALESTIISHGMPYPQNVETALNVEKLIRENGAVPATCAMIGGRLVWGAARYALAGLSGSAFPFSAFLAGAVTSAVPGIVLHIVLIPVLVLVMERAKLTLR